MIYINAYRRFGAYAAARYYRNRGISFRTAYFLMFGKQPKHC